MSEIHKPYVGVSGVISPEQQANIRKMALPLNEVGRNVALGVKAVHKTQWLDTTNKYTSSWYPVGEAISDALHGGNELNEMRIAQVFLDFQASRETGGEEYGIKFIRRLLGRTGNWLTGIQFDLLPWHTADFSRLFYEIKEANPDLDILLQCQGPIMSDLSPSEVMRSLRGYRQYVDYVLFDASHGTGQRLDVESLRPYIAEASSQGWVGAGVAGGLNEQVVREDLPTLLEQFPDLSFDAEGQLHRHPFTHRKDLNMPAVHEYLLASAEVIRSAKLRGL